MVLARERLLCLMEESGYRSTIRPVVPQLFPGSSVHYGGTVRMHSSPKYGVVGKHGNWAAMAYASRKIAPIIWAEIALLAITGATLYFLPAWLIVIWMLVLLGILGGRVFMAQAEDRNRFYLVAFMYVLTLLLLWVVPEMLLDDQHLPPVVARFAREFLPLVLLSIPVSISTHTVTAFLYNGMAARPYWNASILAPRFIASAFCSGPAVMIILFQVLRRAFRFDIKDEAIWKIAELMAYAMFLNLFLLGAELFKEYYSATEHLLYTQYFWQGIGEHRTLVPYAWLSLGCSVAAFLLFLVPGTRRRFVTLNLGCLLIWAGVYVEKGMGLIIPGFTPSTLGQIYAYRPTAVEWSIAVGVFGTGFLVFTLLVKIAVPILVGTFRAPERGADEPVPVAGAQTS